MSVSMADVPFGYVTQIIPPGLRISFSFGRVSRSSFFELVKTWITSTLLHAAEVSLTPFGRAPRAFS